ncbi:MAG: T9SS type A sorting domain-containing protein [Saprospiraceae bacterium]
MSIFTAVVNLISNKFFRYKYFSKNETQLSFFARRKFIFLALFISLNIFHLKAQVIDPCDVDLIEINMVEVTGLKGEVAFDGAQVCAKSDTLALLVSTPGIQCNPAAAITLEKLQIQIPVGYIPDNYLQISGSSFGVYNPSYYTLNVLPGGDLQICFTNVKATATNVIRIAFALLPTCASQNPIESGNPNFSLLYQRPNGSLNVFNLLGNTDLFTGTFNAFLNFVNVQTEPSSALPGDTVCRTVIITQNGQFSELDSFLYVDDYMMQFNNITSFEVEVIEDGVSTGIIIDAMPYIVDNGDKISLQLLASIFGGADQTFGEDDGVIIKYCMEVMCPSGTNNSIITANWGCSNQTCQQTQTSSTVVVNFNGTPDLYTFKTYVASADICDENQNPQWWYDITNFGFEIMPGEGAARNLIMVVNFYKTTDCKALKYTNFKLNGIPIAPIFLNADSAKFDITAQLGDLRLDVFETAHFTMDVIPNFNLGISNCDSVPASLPNCQDPFVRLRYSNLCSTNFSKEFFRYEEIFSFPYFQPVLSLSTYEYERPGYDGAGHWIVELRNQSFVFNELADMDSVQCLIKKPKCNFFYPSNFLYGTDPGNLTALDPMYIDLLSSSEFIILNLPNSILDGEVYYVSFDVNLNCLNANDPNPCYHPSRNCTYPDVKVLYENCRGMKWKNAIPYPEPIQDYNLSPQGKAQRIEVGCTPQRIQYYYRYIQTGMECDGASVYFQVIFPSNLEFQNEFEDGGTLSGGPGGLVPNLYDWDGDTLTIFGGTITNSNPITDLFFQFDAHIICDVDYQLEFTVFYDCPGACKFKRSCDIFDLHCGCAPDDVPIPCYDLCVKTNQHKLFRTSVGSLDSVNLDLPGEPVPVNFGLPCDTFRIRDVALFSREVGAPKACDSVSEISLYFNTGPYLDYLEGAHFTLWDNETASYIPIPCGVSSLQTIGTSHVFKFDTSCGNEIFLITLGDSIIFEADYKVKSSAENIQCAQNFIQQQTSAQFRGKYYHSGNEMGRCSSSPIIANYNVGTYRPRMSSAIQFKTSCSASAILAINEQCNQKKIFRDFRPQYILDSIVYNFTGINFGYQSNTAVIRNRGHLPNVVWSIPDSEVEVIPGVGTSKFVFRNLDGNWPIEDVRSIVDSLFVLNFGLEFAECYDFNGNVQFAATVFYHQGSGGCGPKSLSQNGQVNLLAPPNVILNALSDPVVVIPDDTIFWRIRVAKTPAAGLSWLALQTGTSPVHIFKIYDETTMADITADFMNYAQGIWYQNGSITSRDIVICATTDLCSMVQLNVYAGWSCFTYPIDPHTGVFDNGRSCVRTSLPLRAERAPTGIQGTFTIQPEDNISLCSEVPFEIVVKNVGVGSNFNQKLELYVPNSGVNFVPGSFCLAYPNVYAPLSNPGADVGSYIMLPDPSGPVATSFGLKYEYDLSDPTIQNLLPLNWLNLSNVAELPGVTLPENNYNTFSVKWKTYFDCDFISGGRIKMKVSALDRCNHLVADGPKSSNLISIKGLDPRDFNQYSISILKDKIGACSGEQRLTVNVVGAPNAIADNEFICVTFPEEIQYIPQSASGFSPPSAQAPYFWDLNSEIITDLGSGVTEVCWKLPEGYPGGSIIVFNINVNVSPEADCGNYVLSALTTARDSVVCEQTMQSCLAEITTSEASEVELSILPGLDLEEDQFSTTISCSNNQDVFHITGNISVRNLFVAVAVGDTIPFLIFSDLDGAYDPGEEVYENIYLGGIPEQGIVDIDFDFLISKENVCKLYALIGNSECKCAPSPEPLINSIITNLLPSNLGICENKDLLLLCDPVDSTLEINWSGTGSQYVVNNVFNGPPGQYNLSAEINFGSCYVTESIQFTIYECPCSIGLQAVQGPCDCGFYPIFATVTYLNQGSQGFAYSVDNGPATIIPYNLSGSQQFTISPIYSILPVSITVWDVEKPACNFNRMLIAKDCRYSACTLQVSGSFLNCNLISDSLEVVFTVAGNHTGTMGFNYSLNGAPVVNHAFDPSGITTLVFPANTDGSTWTIEVKDNEKIGCSDTAAVTVPFSCRCGVECPCVMGIYANYGPCNNGIYSINAIAEYMDQSGQAFAYSVNGSTPVVVAYDQSGFQAFNIGPFATPQDFEIIVWDTLDPTCRDTIILKENDCISQPCFLDIIATTNNCDVITDSLDVVFTIVNVNSGAMGFNYSLNGAPPVNHSYDPSGFTALNFRADSDGSTWSIEIFDNEITDCTAYEAIDVRTSCSCSGYCPCSISLFAFPSNCDSGSFNINLIVNYQIQGNLGFSYTVNGGSIINIPYDHTGSQTVVLGPYTIEQLYTINVWDAQFPGCNSSINVQGPDCRIPPCEMELHATTSNCNLTTDSLDVVFTLVSSGTSATGFYYSLNGNPPILHSYDPSGLTILSFPANTDGTYWVMTITDAVLTDCAAFADITLPYSCRPFACDLGDFSFNSPQKACVHDSIKVNLVNTFCGINYFSSKNYTISIDCEDEVSSIQKMIINGQVYTLKNPILFDEGCNNKDPGKIEDMIKLINDLIPSMCAIDVETGLTQTINPQLSFYYTGVTRDGDLDLSIQLTIKESYLCCDQPPLNIAFCFLNKDGKEVIKSLDIETDSQTGSAEYFYNPVSPNYIFNWKTDGGLIVSGDGSSSPEIVWSTPGEKNVCVCVTDPLGDPNCPPEEFCFTINVVEDNLGANVSVFAPQFCLQDGRVDILFDQPEDIDNFIVCNAAGDTIYSSSQAACPGLLMDRHFWLPRMVDGQFLFFPILGTAGQVALFDPKQGFGEIGISPNTEIIFHSHPDFPEVLVVDVDVVDDLCFSRFNLPNATWNDKIGIDFFDFFKLYLMNTGQGAVTDNACDFQSIDVNNFIECDGDCRLIVDPTIDLVYFQVVLDKGINALIFFYKDDSKIDIENVSIEDVPPGEYTIKIYGECGDTALVDFIMPEAPSPDVHIDSKQIDPSTCKSEDGEIQVSANANGPVVSIGLCDALGSEIKTFLNDSLGNTYSQVFSGLTAGLYLVKINTACGDTVLEIALRSLEDSSFFTNFNVNQFTSCAANDASISFDVTTSSPIDSIIVSGSNNNIYSYFNLAPTADNMNYETVSIAVGPPILWGIYKIKVFAHCYYIDTIVVITPPQPSAALQIICNATAPINCLDRGELDISLTYFPDLGFNPDSIVVTGPFAYKNINQSGSRNYQLTNLRPGTYHINAYSYNVCNTTTSICVIPEVQDTVIISNIIAPDLPCLKLEPEGSSLLEVFYQTQPASQNVAYINWFGPNGFIEQHAFLAATSSDTLRVFEPGLYRVEIYTSFPPYDGICASVIKSFLVQEVGCPPNCAFKQLVFDTTYDYDCTLGYLYNLELKYENYGCKVDTTQEYYYLQGYIYNSFGNIIKYFDISGGILTLELDSIQPGNYSIYLSSYISDPFVGYMELCNEYFEIKIPQRSKPIYSFQVNSEPTACRADTGKAKVTAVICDGILQDPTLFKYIWKRSILTLPETSNCIDSLHVGVYQVILLDKYSCQVASSTVTINPTDPVSIAPLQIVGSDNCGMCTGTILLALNGGGPPTYNHLLSDAMGNLIFPVVGTTNRFKNLCPGNYNVVTYYSVSDTVCPAIYSINVPVNTNGLSVTANVSEGSPCIQNDGRVLFTISGSNEPYNIFLRDTNGLLLNQILNSNLSNGQFINLTTGKYVIEVVPVNSPTITCRAMTMIQLYEENFVFNANDISVVQNNCRGQNNASISISNTLGPNQLLIVRDGSNNILGIFNQFSPALIVFNNLAAGSFVITLSGGNGQLACQRIFNVNIVDPPTLQFLASSQVPTACNLNNGSIQINPIGGTLPYSILWAGGLSGFNPTGLSSGTYFFTITDSKGCAITGTRALSLPDCTDPCPEIVAEVYVRDARCDQSDGYVEVSVNNNPNNYNYVWNDGSTLRVRDNLTAGQYSVSITSIDRPECSKVKAVSIGEASGPRITVVPITYTSCNVAVKVNISIANGTAPYLIEYSGTSSGMQILANAGTFGINLSVGNYLIEVTDNLGCKDYANLIVENQAGGLNLNTNIISYPACQQNNGQIFVQANGNPLYKFYLNGILQNTQGSGNFTYQNLTEGIYIVEVIDGLGCRALDTIVLTNGLGTDIDPDIYQITPASCSNGNGSISFDGSGDANLIIEIIRIGGNVPIFSFNADVIGSYALEPGEYYLKITNPFGCVYIHDGIIILSRLPLEFTVTLTDPICARDINNGRLEIQYDSATIPMPIFSVHLATGEFIKEANDVDSLSPGNYIVKSYYLDLLGDTCRAEVPVHLEVPQCIDLALKKTIVPNKIFYQIGDTVEYLITVFNQGQVEINRFEITDYIEGGYLYDLSNNLRTNPWSLNGAIATLQYSGAFIAGDSLEFVISLVLINSQNQDYENIAEISSYHSDDYPNGVDIDSYADQDPNNDGGGVSGGESDDEINGDGTGLPDVDDADTDEDDHDIEFPPFGYFDLALLAYADINVPVVKNQEIPFVFVVYNQGSELVKNIKINALIPSGYDYVLASNPNWMFMSDTGMIFIPQSLDPGDSISVILYLIVRPDANPDNIIVYGEIQQFEDAGGTQRASEDLDSTPDDDKDNDNGGEPRTLSDNEIHDDGTFDEDDHDPAYIEIFDLAMRKKYVSTQSLKPGNSLEYSICVFNQGSISAFNVSINDYLPPSMILDPANLNGWSVVNDSLLTNTIPGPILPGDSVCVSVFIMVLPDVDLSDITNFAEITRAEDSTGTEVIDFDSDPDDDPNNDGQVTDDEIDNGNNDEDDHDGEFPPVFDLALQKITHKTGSVLHGELVKFVIYIYNQGFAPVANIIVAEHLPAGLIFEPQNNIGWSGFSPLLHYTIQGPILSGARDSVCIWLRVSPTARNKDLINFAEIAQAEDTSGNVVSDFDSDPDDDANNDNGADPYGSTDDQINDDGDIDEDDSDAEALFICNGMACNGNLNLSLDGSCTAVITSDMILAYKEFPENMYRIEVRDWNGNLHPNLFSNEDVGDRFKVSIYFDLCNTSCWGIVKIEDKLGPKISCQNDTLNCIEYASGNYNFGTVIECSDYDSVLINEQTIPILCDSHFVKRILQTWTAVDQWGNKGDTCTREILLERVLADSIVPPVDTIIECSRIKLDSKGRIDPLITGLPKFGNTLLYEGSNILCNMNLTFTDIEFPENNCVKKILRNWRLFEWWCNTYVEHSWNQTIKITDTTAPIILAHPLDFEARTNLTNCTADVMIPPIQAYDSCHSVLRIDLTYIGGILSNQNGGKINLPIGSNTIVYQVYDQCGNVSRDTLLVRVVDKTAPVMVCDEKTVVSLLDSGLVSINAISFNQGSYDDCALDHFEIRRMDLNHCGTVGEDSWGPSVNFCCADIGKEIMVSLKAVDASGNENNCMILVQVQDKNKPYIICPPDIDVDCSLSYDLNNISSYFGKISTSWQDRKQIQIPNSIWHEIHGSNLDGIAIDNCGLTISETIDTSGLNACNLGILIRNFTATDAQGNSARCIQKIKIENHNPTSLANIKWPEDLELTGACSIRDLKPENLNPPYNYPVVSNPGCNKIGLNYSDQEFTNLQGGPCVKILREWNVANWCSRDSNGNFEIFTHVQTIKLVNLTAPKISSSCSDTIICSYDSLCRSQLITLKLDIVEGCTKLEDLWFTYRIDFDNNGSIDFNQTNKGNSNATLMWPIGNHRIYWEVTDACGGNVKCNRLIQVKNCLPPTIFCQSSLTVGLSAVDLDGNGIPDGKLAKIFASDFVLKASQPCSSELKVSFSSNVADSIRFYNCDSLGIRNVDIWLSDAYGNSVFCKSQLVITDNPQNLPPCPQTLHDVIITGNIHTNSGNNLEEAEIRFMRSELKTTLTDEQGNYKFDKISAGGSGLLNPSKNDEWLNGVTTADIVKIQKHILGIESLQSPYQYIAADVNRSKTITTRDISEIRKLILGITDTISGNASWRFVTESHQFINNEDALLDSHPESVQFPYMSTDENADFIAVKIGDVTESARTSRLSSVNSRTNKILKLYCEEMELQKNQVYEVFIKSSNIAEFEGFQTTLDLAQNGIQLLEIIPNRTIKFGNENFGLHASNKNKITICWNGHVMNEEELFRIKFKALKTGLLSDFMTLNSSITPSLSVATDGKEGQVELRVLTPDNVDFLLFQNKPNPWKEQTSIGLLLPRGGVVKLTIYDASGRVFLVSDREMSKGYQEWVINGGMLPSSGVYYYQVDYENYTKTRKMIVID